MIDRFTFSSNDLESFLLNASNILPGIEKMIAIYYDGKSDSVLAKMMQPSFNNHVEDLMVYDIQEKIGQLRIGKSRHNWYSREDLPFALEKKPISKASIFNELENVVLLLSFRNQKDKLKDLLFVFFNKNFGNFGISSSNKVLTTDNKQIIATLMYNYFSTQIEVNRHNRELFEGIRSNTNSLIGEVLGLRNELERTRANYGESLANLCIEYTRQFSVESNKQYQLSEEALDKIKTFKGNIKYLYSIIRKSIVFAENISLDQDSDHILIKDYHINLDSFDTEQDREVKSIDQEEKYQKTIQLLDKLENAARTVIGRNTNLTSSNVGNACPTPITAPAITDALRKHKKKILYLFKKYPEKWEVIRREFRPVRNLIISISREGQETA